MRNREIKYYPTTSQWISGGIICLLLVGGLCYLWYNHSIAPYKQEAADTAEAVRQWKKNQKADAKIVAEDKTNIPAESITQTAEKSITETVSTETEDIAIGDPKNVFVETQHSENTDTVEVSSFGSIPGDSGRLSTHCIMGPD